MPLLIVGVADCQLSGAGDAVLVTYALGSCIALMIHDPVAQVGGMIHYMLPASKIDPAKAEENPFLFADTGIPRLFQSSYRLGAEKKRLIVTAAGGAQVWGFQGTFHVGQQNRLALRKILWKAGVLLHAEDVGGIVSRTVKLEVATGRVLLRAGDKPEQEMEVALPGKKE